MGKRVYFTDEELQSVLDAVNDYAFIGHTSQRLHELREKAWALTRRRQQDSPDLLGEEREAHDAAKLYQERHEQKILAKLHGPARGLAHRCVGGQQARAA